MERGLELKVPPPAVALLVAGAMWELSRLTPHVSVLGLGRVGVAVVLLLLGSACMITALFSFRHAKTTVNPLKPEAATALVRSGPFRLSRNPMYLGMLLILVGWAVLLAAPSSLIGPVAFVIYIQRFQIVPEERVLAAKFGEEFERYRCEVRRWV
jgi:protein-S-isoprenylcysteine O-methyltransferase Ste14